jgi:hypothetical protein
MSLSSNALIHLTDSLDTLKAILLDRVFKIKYCGEALENVNSKLTYGVPMVSFFDIPLSELKTQLGDGGYGSYGIGLRADKFKLRGLSPVLYVGKWSTLNRSLKVIYDEILSGKLLEDFSELELSVLNIFRFAKNYEGDLIRKGKLVAENHRFADEKEWRWVPENRDVEMVILPEKIYADETLRKVYNDKIKAMRFVFELPNIQYIIVKDDNEIPEIIKLLYSDAFAQKVMPHPEYAQILNSRIITSKQIISDC